MSHSLFSGPRRKITNDEIAQIEEAASMYELNSVLDFDKNNMEYLQKLYTQDKNRQLNLLESKAADNLSRLTYQNALLQRELNSLEFTYLQEMKQLEENCKHAASEVKEAEELYQKKNIEQLVELQDDMKEMKEEYVADKRWENFENNVKKTLPALNFPATIGFKTPTHFPEAKDELDSKRQTHMRMLVRYVQYKQNNSLRQEQKAKLAKAYYQQIAVQYITMKLAVGKIKIQDLSEKDKAEIKAENLKMVMDNVKGMLDKIEDLEVYLDLLVNKKCIEKKYKDRVIKLLTILRENENFEELMDKLAQLKKSIKHFIKKDTPETSLRLLISEPVPAKDKEILSPREVDFSKYKTNLLHCDIQEIKESDETSLMSVAEIVTMITKAVNGDLIARKQLEILKTKGVLNDEDYNNLLAHVMALANVDNFNLNPTQQIFITRLNQTIKDATSATHLIQTLASLPELDAKMQDFVMASQHILEDVLMPFKKNVEEARQRLEALEAQKNSNKQPPAVQIAKREEWVQSSLEVKVAEQELKQAQDALVVAQSHIKQQAAYLARTYASQLLIAVELYLADDKACSIWYTRKGVEDANDLKRALELLLSQDLPFSFQEVNEFFLPLLRRSNLRDRSLGTIALQILYNEGMPTGLFRLLLDPSAKEQKESKSSSFFERFLSSSAGSGCPDPKRLYHERTGLLRTPKLLSFKGDVQSYLYQSNQLCAKHRPSIRRRAIRNLEEIANKFTILDPTIHQAHRIRVA